MSSQLNVDTIVDKAGSGGTNVKVGNTSTHVSKGGAITQNLVNALATTYCTADGADGSPATVISLNVSSMTDLGVGGYRANLSNNTESTNNPVPANDNERGCGESQNNTTNRIDYQIRNPTNLAAVDATAFMVLLGGLA